MYRLAYEELLEWKNDKDRKPLILEGMRQCGKTYLLKEFGRKDYDNTVYLNFEEDDRLKEIFEHDLDVDRILSRLAITSGEKIVPGRTLIIFDEIQSCGRAITSLKYFCENAPEHHIACAGSLLGVLMSEPYSFPVGKVDRIVMRPMTFKEFLLANGEKKLVGEMDELVPTDRSIGFLSARLEHYMNTFLTVGGMPAAVRSWIEEKDIKKVDRILDGIISDYKQDFSKHASAYVQKLTLIWNSVPIQLAKENKKFVFGHVKTGARARDLEDALWWLINAGLLYKVDLADPSRRPLKMFTDTTSFKIYVADTGIFRRMSGLRSGFGSDLGEGFELLRGALSENYVLCELTAVNKEVPYYWRSNGIAEVDFVVSHEDHPIPIEVKSGHNNRSKSLTEFIDKFRPKAAIIASLDIRDGDIVKKIPLYWMWRYRAVIPE